MGASHPSGAKGGPTGVARTAEEPGQTVNVDLCFVPAQHAPAETLPAVSGSSGRLVVTPHAEVARPTPSWPGRIFEDPALDYTDAMQAFVAASAAPARPPDAEQTPEQEEAQQRKEAHRILRQKAEALRAERRQVRAQRSLEDAVWQVLAADRRGAAAPDENLPAAEEAQWRRLRAQRRATLAQRQGEDTAWRQQRHALRQEHDQEPGARTWIAVLVLTDNCTRQCLGLPLFIAGAKVTAAMVTAALRTLLPPELQFLISDRGTHFTAHELADLARERDFLHVRIARHRPESNGIAERFVQTVKTWLRAHPWTCADELAALLARFKDEYNARPHQGLSIPGLSPHEFAQRVWLM